MRATMMSDTKGTSTERLWSKLSKTPNLRRRHNRKLTCLTVILTIFVTVFILIVETVLF